MAIVIKNLEKNCILCKREIKGCNPKPYVSWYAWGKYIGDVHNGCRDSMKSMDLLLAEIISEMPNQCIHHYDYYMKVLFPDGCEE